MLYTRFVIRQTVVGVWRYLPIRVMGSNSDDPCGLWPEDPYPSMKFATYDEAEKYLKTAISEQNWGGIFEITKIFISK